MKAVIQSGGQILNRTQACCHSVDLMVFYHAEVESSS